MKKRILGISLLAFYGSLYAGQITDGQIKDVAVDLVIHYDRAVVMGTTNEEYIAGQEESVFEQLRKNIGPNDCQDIALYNCALDLICHGPVGFMNLQPELVPCQDN